MSATKKRKPIPPRPPLGNKYAVGHGFGRPRTYDDAFIEKEATEFLAWTENPTHIWMEDFALERGYSPKRFYEWEKRSPVFAEVLEYVKQWQKSKLAKGGLTDEFNAGFCKFVMGNTCGWYEKTQVSGDSANPLAFVLDRTDGTSKELVDEQA